MNEGLRQFLYQLREGPITSELIPTVCPGQATVATLLCFVENYRDTCAGTDGVGKTL